MPTYDYRCTQCGHQVEVMHPITGTGPTDCERCGGAMRKALSSPAIHFKGSGWAKKDAQAASKPKADKADKAAGEASGASGAEGGPSGGSDKPGSGDKGTGDTGSGEKPAKAAATASGTASD